MTDDTERQPFHEWLPPARQYMREEWVIRTWCGRSTLPFEAVVVFIGRLLSKLSGKTPRTYRTEDTEVDR